MKKYDYLIVGAGLFGAVFAHEAAQKGKTCLVIDKRDHIGGNIYTEEVEGIQVHRYGAHIFHTSKKNVWEYVNQFADFNHFVNSPVAIYKDELYNLPFKCVYQRIVFRFGITHINIVIRNQKRICYFPFSRK